MYSYKSWTMKITSHKQFTGIRLYICTTLVQVLSKSNFVLIVFFVCLFFPLVKTATRRLVIDSIIFIHNTLSLSSSLQILLMQILMELRFVIFFLSNHFLMISQMFYIGTLGHVTWLYVEWFRRSLGAWQLSSAREENKYTKKTIRTKFDSDDTWTKVVHIVTLYQ